MGRKSSVRRMERARQRRQAQLPTVTPGQNLGSYGAERAPVLLTFTWYGQDIRVHPEAGAYRELDFMEAALEVDANDPRAMILIKDQMRELVHPKDFTRFWDICRRENPPPELLHRLLHDLFAAVAAYPTGPLADSSDGPASTPPRSESDPVMRRLDGRPDLKLAVLRADQGHAELEATAG